MPSRSLAGRLAKRLAIANILIFIQLSFCSALSAQSQAVGNSWEVMRIFVAERDIGSMVPRDYSPVLMESFAKDLQRESERRQQAQLDAPHIEDALYVVRLQNGSLVSDHSRWSIQSNRPNASFSLEDCNVSLRASTALASDQKSLIQSLRFSSDGKASISEIKGDSDYWFGFSAAPSKQMVNQSTFQLSLPKSTISRMILSVPENVQISSTDVNVRGIEGPFAFVPNGWPTSSTASPASRWYFLNLSGLGRFSLTATVTEKRDFASYNYFIRRSNLMYSVDPGGVKLNAEFELGQPSGATKLSLRIDKSLKMRSAWYNELPLQWKLDSSSDPLVNIVEVLTNEQPSAGGLLRFEAFGESNLPMELTLPGLAIDRAFTWEGRTTLQSKAGLDVSDFRIASSDAKPPISMTTGATSWQCDWIGSPPPLRAQFKLGKNNWAANTFTRLLLQNDSLAATANARLSCTNLNCNELRLDVGEGWFVDDISIGQSDLPVQVRLPDDKLSDIVLSWENATDAIRIDVQVSAHRPREAEADVYTMVAPRLIHIKDAEQIDVYGIEQTSGYQIEPDIQLQRLKIANSELPSWQANLLARLSDAAVYKGQHNIVPPLVLKRSEGTYASDVKVLAKAEAQNVRIVFFMEVYPNASAIDHINFQLNLPKSLVESEKDFLWYTVQDQVASSLKAVRVNATSPESEALYEIELPEPTTSKLSLRHELVIPVQDSEFDLPLMSAPFASATVNTIVVPRRFSIPLALGLEALPAGACCISADVADSVGGMAETTAAFHYDPSVITSVKLKTNQTGFAKNAWAWSQHTDHRFNNEGRITHQCNWSVYSAVADSHVITVPSDWSVDRCLVNNEVQDIHPASNSSEFMINLPRGERVNLSLQCSSRVAISLLVSELELPTPRLAMETLDQSSTLWLPPGKVSMDALVANKPLKLVSALIPRNYWSWLTPVQIQNSVFAQFPKVGDEANSGWTRIELKSSHVPSKNLPVNKAQIADQSCVAAIFIGSVLISCASWLLILRNRVNAWLLTLMSLILLAIFLDSPYSLLGQVLLLSYACAALAKLVGNLTLVQSRSSLQPSQRGSTVLNRDLVKVGSILVAASICCRNVHGQNLNGGVNGSTPTVFGVIIPINDEKVMSAGHAYVPNKLIKILENTSPLETENSDPQILGAKYLLRLRGGTGTTESYVQEFTVEFELAFPKKGTSIRLPFKSSQVQLLRGVEDGQAVSIGSQVLKTNDAIIYRPAEFEPTTLLRLQLIPTVSTVGDRSFIEMSIPKVATATLDVTSDEALDVQVAGMGETRRTAISNLQKSDLGPTDTLKVSWPTRTTRLSASNPAQIQSDTLVHFRENQLLAECQIRIGGANALPKQLHLVVDAGWEPIGDIWNDARLISSELAATGNRRVYTVVRPDSKDNIVVRVLMVPRNMSTISTTSLPFISFKEGAFSSGAFPNRTFSISSDRRPSWKLSGADQWTQLKSSVTDLQWDSISNPQSPIVLKVPSGPINATLQRTSTLTQANSVREDSILDLSSDASQLTYRVEWFQSTSDVSFLRVDIPAHATPQSVTLDGVEAKYLISKKAGGNLLTIARETNTTLRRMDIRFRLPTPMNNTSSLPRAILQDCQATTSTYRVNCHADLNCSLVAEPETNLQFIQSASDPAELLRSFNYCVGQTDLVNGFRDSVSLPIRYELTQRDTLPPKSNLMQLIRSEQGWRAKLEVVFESSGHADFVFFDVPANFRELMEPSGIPYSISAESAGRSTLCIASQSPNKLSRVAFQFRLPSLGASQSIAIPDIQLLGKKSQRPVLALPTHIDRQPVRWTRAGRKLNDDWASKQNIGLASGEFVYFELDGQQQQTTWSTVEVESKVPELLNAVASLTDRGGGQVAGVVDYWIEPNGNLEITGRVPGDCELVAVRTGSLNAVWSLEDKQVLRILMQPSFLPVRVRLYMKWPLDLRKLDGQTHSNAAALSLPKLDVANFRQLHVAVQSVEEIQRIELRSHPTAETWQHESSQSATTMEGSITSFSIVARSMTQAWKQLLMKAPPVATNTGELTSWIKDWNFSNIGLSGQHLIPRAPSDPETLKDQTVAGFWRWYVGKFDEGVAQLIDDEVPNENLDDHEVEQTLHITPAGARKLPIRWFTVDNPNQDLMFCKLIMRKPIVDQKLGPRIWASLAIVGLTAIGYWIAARFRRMMSEYVAANPWIYWMLLACLTWIIVPMTWPSVVILGCSIGILLNQLAATRRRALAYRRS